MKNVEYPEDSKDHQTAAAHAAARVLLVDTAENEGVDFLQALKQREMKFIFERVSAKAEIFKALQNGTWDILLVNDLVDELKHEEVLAYLEQINSDTGFVLLSNAEITTEFLTTAYKQGMSDVVTGSQLDYSLAVFSRAAERSRRNLQLSQLNQEKFELATHRDQLMSGTEEALAYLHDGIHVFGNAAYLDLLGYSNMYDLIVLPFIDIVSTELRDKVKQSLLDFQHKVRLKPETPALEIEEMFVAATGVKEGILQVHAAFKPVVYDGEDCLQVILKDSNSHIEKEAPSATEGLGYPLFITHLDNLVAEANASGSVVGHVIHIHGNGLEHYLADKGFGSLNGKMKALASELKSSLQSNDFMIRFTENSFLVLLNKNHEQNGVASKENENENHPALSLYPELLGQFQRALNKEIDKDETNAVITFAHEVIPVASDSESAENLIRSFLISVNHKAPKESIEAVDSNVVPFAKKPEEQIKREEPGHKQKNEVHSADKKKPAAEKVKLLNKQTRQQSGARSAKKAASKTQPPKKVIKSGKNPCSEPGQIKIPVVEIPDQLDDASLESLPIAQEVSIDELELALKANQLKLFYEPLLSVTEIETELYDLGLYLEDGITRISRDSLGAAMGKNPLAAKLDFWAIENALQIIEGFYNQGLEYRALLSVSASSLLDEHFIENVDKAMENLSLPREILIIDFHLNDLQEDLSAACEQLNQLIQTGCSVCVSGVTDTATMKNVISDADISLVRLDNSIIANAIDDAATFSSLKDLIEFFHTAKTRVIAGNINTSDLLSICCKAQVDLVKGDYIQKEPLPLTAESLFQEMTV